MWGGSYTVNIQPNNDIEESMFFGLQDIKEETKPCIQTDDGLLDVIDRFNDIPVEHWRREECLDWGISAYKSFGVPLTEDFNISSFGKLTGRKLLNFTEKDFCKNINKVTGVSLYRHFNKLLSIQREIKLGYWVNRQNYPTFPMESKNHNTKSEEVPDDLDSISSSDLTLTNDLLFNNQEFKDYSEYLTKHDVEYLTKHDVEESYSFDNLISTMKGTNINEEPATGRRTSFEAIENTLRTYTTLSPVSTMDNYFDLAPSGSSKLDQLDHPTGYQVSFGESSLESANLNYFSPTQDISPLPPLAGGNGCSSDNKLYNSPDLCSSYNESSNYNQYQTGSYSHTMGDYLINETDEQSSGSYNLDTSFDLTSDYLQIEQSPCPTTFNDLESSPTVSIDSIRPKTSRQRNSSGPIRRRLNSGGSINDSPVVPFGSFDADDGLLTKIPTGNRRSRFRSPKSWEFIVRLLKNPNYNPSLIKWENEKEGIFRLVKKDEIAKIWSARETKDTKPKQGKYDSFARILRYHYKTGALVPVSEKHLVYKFSVEKLQEIQSGNIQ